MTKRVLMVCLGNICRSPMAEAVFRTMAAARGLAVRVDSAGTSDWNLGQPPHDPALRAARARGFDMRGLRARQVRRGDFDRFDLIAAMDASNLAALERLRPPGNTVPVVLLGAYGHGGEVPDPYVTGDYAGALDLIEAGCAGLVAALQS